MPQIQPERIRLARRLMHLSMDDLVGRMGDRAVSKMSISKMERGLLNPSQDTLQALADACQQPLSFFLVPQPDLATLDFRFKADVSQRQRNEVKALVDNLLQHYCEMQSMESRDFDFVHPMPHTVLRNYGDAEAAALKLRRKWDIGVQPIHAVYELLACHGIHVLEADFGCQNIDGTSTIVTTGTPTPSRIPIIIINTRANATTCRRRFTALHELCHILFRLRPDNDSRHQTYLDTLPPTPHHVTIKPPTAERLCDLFASAMLMPQPCAMRRFGTLRTDVSLPEFTSTLPLYGISVAAQIHRLHDLRIIDDDSYKRLYQSLILPNPLEQDYGIYPIPETADRPTLLELRLQTELKDSAETIALGERAQKMPR